MVSGPKWPRDHLDGAKDHLDPPAADRPSDEPPHPGLTSAQWHQLIAWCQKHGIPVKLRSELVERLGGAAYYTSSDPDTARVFKLLQRMGDNGQEAEVFALIKEVRDDERAKAAPSSSVSEPNETQATTAKLDALIAAPAMLAAAAFMGGEWAFPTEALAYLLAERDDLFRRETIHACAEVCSPLIGSPDDGSRSAEYYAAAEAAHECAERIRALATDGSSASGGGK